MQCGNILCNIVCVAIFHLFPVTVAIQNTDARQADLMCPLHIVETVTHHTDIRKFGDPHAFQCITDDIRLAVSFRCLHRCAADQIKIRCQAKMFQNTNRKHFGLGGCHKQLLPCRFQCRKQFPDTGIGHILCPADSRKTLTVFCNGNLRFFLAESVILRERCRKRRSDKASKAVKALNPFDDREEYNEFMDLFTNLMNAILARDLMRTLECGESIAALESREKQKSFCNFAGECIRKIFMLGQNMPQLAEIDPQENEFYARVSKSCSGKFCAKAMTNIEKVVALIDRNVSSRILFCDLVNRLFLSI